MILLTSSAPACNRCMSISPHGIRSNPRRNHKWVIDSGASVHCTSDPTLLTSVYYKHPPVLIKVADNRTLQAHAVGTAILSLLDQHHKTHHVTLHNVIYHPNFHTNLLSVRRLWLDNHIMCSSTTYKTHLAEPNSQSPTTDNTYPPMLLTYSPYV